MSQPYIQDSSLMQEALIFNPWLCPKCTTQHKENKCCPWKRLFPKSAQDTLPCSIRTNTCRPFVRNHRRKDLQCSCAKSHTNGGLAPRRRYLCLPRVISPLSAHMGKSLLYCQSSNEMFQTSWLGLLEYKKTLDLQCEQGSSLKMKQKSILGTPQCDHTWKERRTCCPSKKYPVVQTNRGGLATGHEPDNLSYIQLFIFKNVKYQFENGYQCLKKHAFW